jgi:hypothetical protein
VDLTQHVPAADCKYNRHTFQTLAHPRIFFGFFCVGYKGGTIYWLAIHSNQANLIVGGLRHRRHQQTRQAPLFQEVPSTQIKNSREVEPLHPEFTLT